MKLAGADESHDPCAQWDRDGRRECRIFSFLILKWIVDSSDDNTLGYRNMGRTKGYIRWLIRRDMKEVMEIERLCFGDDSLAEQDVIEMLRKRNNIGMVIEVNEAVVGYMMYLLHTHSIELLRIAVHPHHQRHGLGSQLIEKILSKLTVEKRRRATFLVPDHLLGTHLFLKASGFRATCHGDQYHFYKGVQWKEQSLQRT